jgi:hypothetical protein
MKTPVIVLSLLVILGQAVFALRADVTVVTTYPGNKGPGWKQTIDVAGAVGPKHVVDFESQRWPSLVPWRDPAGAGPGPHRRTKR